MKFNGKKVEFNYKDYDLSKEHEVYKLVNDINIYIDELIFEKRYMEQKLLQIANILDEKTLRR